MSIATDITRIQTAKTDIAAAITAKGLTVPVGTKIDGMADIIDGFRHKQELIKLIQRSTESFPVPFWDNLPSEITVIGAYAFAGYNYFRVAELPSGLTVIGGWAFKGCGAFNVPSLPAGITSIGTGAFATCTSLALTSLPPGITRIEEETFKECECLALTAIPYGVTYIGMRAFIDCYEILTLDIPSTVTIIQMDAFANGYMTDMVIHKPAGSISGAPWGAYSANITWTG